MELGSCMVFDAKLANFINEGVWAVLAGVVKTRKEIEINPRYLGRAVASTLDLRYRGI